MYGLIFLISINGCHSIHYNFIQPADGSLGGSLINEKFIFEYDT